MPSTKPRRNVRIIETLQKYFGGRTHQPVRVEHSALATPRLRNADESARLADAVLNFRKLMAHVDALPEAGKQAILASGGDACNAPQFVEVMQARREMYMGPAKLLAASMRLAEQGDTEAAARFVQYAQQEVTHDKMVAQLAPIALQAEPAHVYTFRGLFARWNGPRVKASSVRNYERTTRRLEECFGAKYDIRKLGPADARKFLEWLRANVNGRASQKADLGHAFTLFDQMDRHELPNGNPFIDAKKLRREVGHVGKTKGAFSQQQLAKVIEIVKRARIGENQISKRCPEVYWMLMVLAHTGARPNEIASLRKGDLGVEDGVDFIHIREDHPEKTVKGRKDEDNSRKVPLHSAIAGDFKAFVKTVQTDFIFGKFDWSKDHGRAHWLMREFAPFLRKYAAEIGIKLVDKIDPKTGETIKQAVDKDNLELTLHRIRGTFENTMGAAGIDQRVIDDITGHKIKTVAGKHYRKQLPLPVLARELEKVKPLGSAGRVSLSVEDLAVID